MIEDESSSPMTFAATNGRVALGPDDDGVVNADAAYLGVDMSGVLAIDGAFSERGVVPEEDTVERILGDMVMGGLGGTRRGGRGVLVKLGWMRGNMRMWTRRYHLELRKWRWTVVRVG